MTARPITHTDYFEALCALAVRGQISEPAFLELQDHMQQCPDCQSVDVDFADLLHNKLLLADPELRASAKPPGRQFHFAYLNANPSAGYSRRPSPHLT